MMIRLLKESKFWKKDNVKNWLENNWLNQKDKWVKAYRDQEFHALVDTNNGTEAQNRVLKHTYLKYRRDKTLTSLVEVMFYEWFPAFENSYVSNNVRVDSTCKRYNRAVPSYLRDLPRPVVVHVMERLLNSLEFGPEDVTAFAEGQLRVGTKTVDLRKPSCTGAQGLACEDWIKHNKPCKHMCYGFRVYPETHGWQQLPESYRNSAYLSVDKAAIIHAFGSGQYSDGVSSEGDADGDDIDLDPPSAIPPQEKTSNVRARSLLNVKVALKDLETLSHACSDPVQLQLLGAQLGNIAMKFKEDLPKSGEGLTLLAMGQALNHSSTSRHRMRRKRPVVVVGADEIPPATKRGKQKEHGVFKRVGRGAEAEQKRLQVEGVPTTGKPMSLKRKVTTGPGAPVAKKRLLSTATALPAATTTVTSLASPAATAIATMPSAWRLL
jgi:hypothetical protein